MSYTNELSIMQMEDVLSWLDTFPLSRTNKKINRDFSDGVMLAEILKGSFPKMVDLHNYTSGNSFSQKMDNWYTLNRKVLKKIGLGLQTQIMEDLASAIPGAAEVVLSKVKEKIHEIRELEKGDSKICECLIGGNPEVFTVPRHKHDGDKLEIVQAKVILYSAHEKILKELSEKSDAVNILKQKVEHMENLIHIKDQRIGDLLRQLGRSGHGNNPVGSNLPLPTSSRSSIALGLKSPPPP